MFASWQVAAGAMAFSDLVVFLMHFSYFSSSVSQFVGFISYAREAAVGDERIRDFETLVHPRSLPSSCHKEGRHFLLVHLFTFLSCFILLPIVLE